MLERQSLERFVGTRINSYIVDQVVEQSELGALFLARDSLSGNQYVLGVLSLSLAAEIYSNGSSARETFQHQANTIASLQHPYILPLVDYGSVGDIPYLVWPSVPTRPLSNRLAQTGSLDLLTVGRYLDQIAGALEYAHEHLVLHRNLTVDALSLQRDGRVLVHDFGVRRMLEQGRKDAEWYALRNWHEACAPEQILGLPANPATDVYALGVILYQLLTGDPPYSGASRKDIMQQHLQAPVPSLRFRRPDLPADLDEVLSIALAKQSSDRFSQPGALANAYQDIVSPQLATRVPFKLGAGAPGTGSIPSHSQVPNSRTFTDRLVSDRREAVTSGPQTPATSYPPEKPAPVRSARVSPLRTLLIAGVLLALILGTILTVSRVQSQSALTASGQVSFMDSGTNALGETNALSIQIHGLTAPASGYAYHAWLVNQHAEQVLALGTLSKNGNQSYSLSYSVVEDRTNLLGVGNQLEITLEQGNVTLPSGKVVMSGQFPAQAFVHIGHLLVAYPTTPANTGLLVGAVKQTTLLDTQAQALSKSAAQQDIAAVDCEAQSILDIIQGKSGPQYQPISSICTALYRGEAGDGFGLQGPIDPTSHTPTGYLPEASEHAALAATQPDATANIRTHAHNVEVAIADVQGWVTTIQQDALLLQKTPLAPSISQAILALADETWNGAGGSGNQTNDIAAGVSGMSTAYAQGQDMALLPLVSKS